MSSRRSTVAGLLLEQAERQPATPALVEDGNRTITYGDLADRARRLASVLVDAGISGGRVGLWLPEGQWIDHATGYFAALLAGSVAVVLPTDASARTLRTIASDAGVGLVLTVDDTDTSFADAPSLGMHAPHGTPPLAGPEKPPVLADVIFTSGSTGAPKAVAASHDTLVGIAGRYRLRPGGARVVGHALSHSTALGTRQLMLVAVARGATLVSCLPPRADRFLRLATEWDVTTAVLPAAIGRSVAQALAADPAATPPRLRHLRFVSDQLQPDLHERLAGLLPEVRVVNTYGLTEGGDAHLVITADDCRRGPGGRPAAGTQVRIRLASGDWAAPGEAGVVCVRDGNEPMSYLTGHGWVPQVWSDGWTRTGDLGMLDDDGRVRLLGRVEAHARVGGHTVSLAEVEQALTRHHAVEAAAVVALPHPTLGQVVAAVVQAPPTLDRADVHAALRRSLPAYALPTPLLRVERIPLSRNGKPLREAIERMVRDQLAPPPEPCRTEMEKAISDIWVRVLDTDREFGRNDSFIEQGGDSLAAIQVLIAVEELAGVEIPPEALTLAGNLGEFAAAVERLRPAR